MVIVIPMITNNKVVFGIYSICISVGMFLSYADLGFVKAGLKYAGESFAKGNKEEEIEYYGFSGFLLFVFVSLFASVFLMLSFYPELLISDLSTPESVSIASNILLIQAIFSFNTILQRLVNGICSIRIEIYIFQRISIIGSIISITSVFFFFGFGNYDIVGYYLFIKIIELLILVVGFMVVLKRYNISFKSLIKNFNFNKKVFTKTKKLAYSSLFVTIMWVLYYELDIIVIGKTLGIASVAIYAVAFTFMKFLRSFSGIIFSPFQDRFNHFVGLDDLNGLKIFLEKIILFSMPILFFTITSIVVLSKKIILCYVGVDYTNSFIILSILAINYCFAFITTPGSNIIVSLERIKEIYKINFIMVLVFWTGIFFTITYWGIYSFPIFKLIAGIISVYFYLKILLKFMNISFMSFMRKSLFQITVPLIIQIIFLIIILPFLPETKGTLNLFIVIGVGGFAALLGFLSLYLISNYYKLEVKKYILNFDK